MATTNDLKNGLVLNLDNQLWQVLEFQHVKPGKGGAFVRTKLKNAHTGAVIDRTFRSGDKVEEVRLERREMQFLYADGETYHFMDAETYEQSEITADTIGKAANLLKENETAFVLIALGKPISVDLPTFVSLQITHTEPGIKGDTATGAAKPATLETGAVVTVPLFVNQGDTLKIDTRTGEYVERL